MKKVFKWLGILAGGFFVLIVLAAIFGSPKEKSAAAPQLAEAGSTASARGEPVVIEAAPKPVAIEVSALQLYKAYDDNEVAADQRYKGKALAVTGTVLSIDKDAFDNIVVQLRGDNDFMGVHAGLDDEHEALAASLKKGTKVKWKCDGGGRILTSPVLRNCGPV